MKTIMHCPGFPLPYKAVGYSVRGISHGEWFSVASCALKKFTNEGKMVNAAYLAHAANAYPKLVQALHKLADQVDNPELATGAHVNAAILLRELGEY